MWRGMVSTRAFVTVELGARRTLTSLGTMSVNHYLYVLTRLDVALGSQPAGWVHPQGVHMRLYPLRYIYSMDIWFDKHRDEETDMRVDVCSVYVYSLRRASIIRVVVYRVPTYKLHTRVCACVV